MPARVPLLVVLAAVAAVAAVAAADTAARPGGGLQVPADRGAQLRDAPSLLTLSSSAAAREGLDAAHGRAGFLKKVGSFVGRVVKKVAGKAKALVRHVVGRVKHHAKRLVNKAKDVLGIKRKPAVPDRDLAFDKVSYPSPPPNAAAPPADEPQLDYFQLMKKRIDDMTGAATEDAFRREAAVIGINQDPKDYEDLTRGITPDLTRRVMGPSDGEAREERRVAEAVANGEMAPEPTNVITTITRDPTEETETVSE